MIALMENTLLVTAIKNGTVIDHIPCGQAIQIIFLLSLSKGTQPITIGLNLVSQKLGNKDLIKIENRQLTEREADQIAIFAPNATINLVNDFRIEKKLKPTLPNEIEHVLLCPNHRCISRNETSSFFYVESFKNKVHLRCKFCEKFFERSLMSPLL
jgi:aspartate carbamoyltransferase regulatory subunit